MLKLYNDLLISDNFDEVNITPETLTGFFIAFYCEQGAIQFTIEDKRYVAETGDLVVSTPRHIIGSYMRTPDLRGKIICAGVSLFDNTTPELFHLDPNWWKKMDYLSQNPVSHTTGFQSKLFLAYYNLLEIYLDDSENPYRNHSIKLLAQSVVVEIMHELEKWNVIEEDEKENEVRVSQKDRLLQRFISMLAQFGNTDREVKSYADRLLITPKYLSHICKEKSGRTASEWIAEATLRNIKYYLLQTDFTVKEIAYKMDFPDISFFCKYVKKHLGQSPMEYRKNPVELPKEG